MSGSSPENEKKMNIAFANSLQKNHVNLLRTLPLFSGFTPDELLHFTQRAELREFRKGMHIFSHGEPAEHFYVMLEGWVKLYRANKDGEETVISLATKGNSFSEVATFDGSDYPYGAQVVGGTAKLLVIPASIIRQKVQQSPDLALKMLSSMAHHTNQLSFTFEHITKLTTAQRLGCFLLKLSMDRRYKTQLQLPYNKYLVASRLGMQAETFSRAMKRLTTDLGITFKGREVTIPNIDALQNYCEVECFNHDSCGLEKRLLCTNPQCDIYRILKLM